MTTSANASADISSISLLRSSICVGISTGSIATDLLKIIRALVRFSCAARSSLVDKRAKSCRFRQLGFLERDILVDCRAKKNSAVSKSAIRGGIDRYRSTSQAQSPPQPKIISRSVHNRTSGRLSARLNRLSRSIALSTIRRTSSASSVVAKRDLLSTTETGLMSQPNE